MNWRKSGGIVLFALIVAGCRTPGTPDADQTPASTTDAPTASSSPPEATGDGPLGPAPEKTPAPKTTGKKPVVPIVPGAPIKFDPTNNAGKKLKDAEDTVKAGLKAECGSSLCSVEFSYEYADFDGSGRNCVVTRVEFAPPFRHGSTLVFRVTNPCDRNPAGIKTSKSGSPSPTSESTG